MAATAESEMTSSLPQAALFAPSRKDILSSLAFFFGDPANPEKLRDYSEHQAATYHFPDAFYGTNNRIRDTLNNLVLKSPQDWQTTVALPFVQITGTTVEWDEMHFDVRLLQRVPAEGTSRMTTSLRRRHRDRVVRRGVGMIIESDFYSTDAGRAHFQDQLTSIKYCVQETCNFDVLFSYLTCGNYDFRYDQSKGLRPKRSIRQAMHHEISMYSIVQREGLGMDKAVEICKDRMSRYGVRPDIMIVPPSMLLYLTLAPEEKIRFIEGGERAVSKFEEGKAGIEARGFRGLGVFTSMPFEVSDDSDSVQMLQRSSQVGEFYRMSPPPVFDKSKALPGSYMDIMIYDEEADKLQHIEFEQAMWACCITDAEIIGVPGDPNKPGVFGDPVALQTAAQEHFNNLDADVKTKVTTALNAKAVVAGTAANGVAAGGAVNAGVIELKMFKSVAGIVNVVKAGICVKVCITIARPFIEHNMLSAVLAVAGRDTGATLYGPADMQISANTSVKTIEGHFTCHTKSTIHKPQNVLVMRDIMCNGYVAGGNCKWFGAEGKLSGPLADTAVKLAIQERLAYTDDLDADYGSMLAFASPYVEVETSARDQVISISNRLLPWEVSKNGGTDKSVSGFPGGNPGYNRYMSKYGLNQIHFGEDVRAAENMEFISNGSMNNSTCIIGPHRKYSPYSQNFYELCPGQGHFGPDAIPGDARWRRGEAVSLKSARDSMVSLEVAAHSQLALGKANSM